MQSEEPHSQLAELSSGEPPHSASNIASNRNDEHGNGNEHSSNHKFLISIRTMDFQLRILTGTVLAGVAAAVILIAARDSLPSKMFDIGGGATLTIPEITYRAAAFGVILGLAFLTHGTFEAAKAGRLLFIGVLLAFFAIYVGLFERGLSAPFASLLLKTLFYCASAGFLLRGYRKHYSPERQSNILIWSFVLLSVSPGILLVFGAPTTFTYYLILLWYPLPIFYMLAGTDWAEILDAGAQSALKRRLETKSSGWLVGAGIIVCCGFAAAMVILSEGPVWSYLPPMIGAAVFVGVVFWAAQIDESWEEEFSWAGLTILTATFLLLLAGDAFFRGTPNALPFWPICFSAAGGTVLIVCARRSKFTTLWPVLLFGVILGMFWAVVDSSGEAPSIAAIYGSMFAIPAVSLLGIVMLLWLQRKGCDVREGLRDTIFLNVGCAGLYLVTFVVYKSALAMSDRGRLLQALVVFAALLWDIAASGHSITNKDGRIFPRRSRVYLYFGYILLVTATVVFWNSAVVSQSDLDSKIKPLMDPETFVTAGIVSFGPATLLTLFVLRVAKWLPNRQRNRRLQREAEGGVS